MDQASQEVLTGLLRGLERQPWRLVLTRRPGDDGFVVPQVASTRIELQPLTGIRPRRDPGGYRRSPPTAPPGGDLAERAAGTLLFLIELLSATDREERSSTFLSVEGLISARIDRLPAADRNLLQRVAVLGNGFEAEHTASVLPTLEPQRGPGRFAGWPTSSVGPQWLARIPARPDQGCRLRGAALQDPAELRPSRRLDLRAAATTRRTVPTALAALFVARRWGDAWRSRGWPATAPARSTPTRTRRSSTSALQSRRGFLPRDRASRQGGGAGARWVTCGSGAGMFTPGPGRLSPGTQLTDDPVALAELKLKRSVVRNAAGRPSAKRCGTSPPGFGSRRLLIPPRPPW